MQISKKAIAKTILLPGLLPRIGELFGGSLNYFAFLIAQIYGMVRILPENHPYLSSKAYGTFTTRQAIAAAAENIKFTRSNIDQIIIFFVIIAAIFIFIIQFVLFFVAFFVSTANAQTIPTTIEGFFRTNNPQEDLAFRMLDLTFGHPDFFGSKDAGGTTLHTALQSMLELYSFGMIIVGAMIIIYFVIVVVNETAQTGIPFGKRFKHAWVPIRLIVFFGLLIPVSNGFNGGQYITLTMAKLGSGLATTGWTLFNDTVAATGSTILGEREHNVAEPNAPINQLMLLPEFMTYVNICRDKYEELYNDRQFEPTWNSKVGKGGVRPWAVFKNRTEGATAQYTSVLAEKLSFQELSAQANGNNIYIVFGVKDPVRYDEKRGYVEPVCGSLVMEISDLSEPGSQRIQNGYLELVKEMWSGANQIGRYAKSFVKRSSSVNSDPDAELPPDDYKDDWLKTLNSIINGKGGGGNGQCKPVDLTEEDQEDQGLLCAPCKSCADCQNCPSCQGCTFCTENCAQPGGGNASAPFLANSIQPAAGAPADSGSESGGNGGLIQAAVQAQRNQGAWEMPQEMRDYGWAGAAIWYNKIAEQNGALVTAVNYAPRPVQLPRVMEIVRKAKLAEDQSPDPRTLFQLNFSEDSIVPSFPLGAKEEEIAHTLGNAYYYWNIDKDEQIGLTGNFIIDIINATLGTEGLFEICRNTDIHPLAQLSMIGKSMLESSIRSFGISVGATIFSIIPSNFISAGAAFASFFGTISGVGLLLGFLLFYIMPFMPFMYFFFALGSWVKTIFEAMVAMPLWALAHLRIDGDGLPGSAAMNGYFLLFEIFIRPILIVFGLLAAISVFAAMVKVLNDVFYLAVTNMAGANSDSATLCTTISTREQNPEMADSVRGTIDQFFFTIVYAIFVYLIGISCFKLIDNIPKSILRWLNAGTDSFLDNSEDPAEGLRKYVALAGSKFGGDISKGVSGLGQGARESGQQVASFFSGK